MNVVVNFRSGRLVRMKEKIRNLSQKELNKKIRIDSYGG